MYFIEERINRILNELSGYGYIVPESEPVPSFKMKEGNFKGGEQPGLDTSGWEPFVPDNRWGGKNRHFWFRTEVTMPERFEGKKVVFEVKTGREGDWDALNPQFLIYKDGQLVQGLDVNHREITLTEKAVPGKTYSIALHAYSGMKDGLVELNAKISVLDPEVEKLYYDIKVPLEVAALLPKDDKKRIDILNYLNEAINLLDLRKGYSEAFRESVKEAEKYLEKEFYSGFCGHEDIIASCIGHTHIDVAWLWTLAQTREKTARSFSTVLNLMKDYPEYVFMSSQPQLYKFIKEDHPGIYEEIRKRVQEGRWEPEGAMWLEADCNVSSGEALVRQVLFGTRFFRNEFGVENRILWLPDVFGYSAALPQILKKSGIDYFMTTKISWNEYNKVPYDTFMWKGMDGTEILTHFITTRDPGFKLNPHVTTYNGNLVPAQVCGAWDRYQQKDINSDVLISFGYGDGGGGPTKEMLENARRMDKGIPGCPKVKMVKSLDFFKKLEKTVSGKKRLPKWVGELYLEYHRGTYTSMARNKKFNRKSEFLYQDVELLSSISRTAAGTGIYPQEKINKGWETILLNQFHDILPGSSIKEVYEDSKVQYTEILSEGRKLLGSAVDNIASVINLSGTSVIVFNQLGFERTDIAEFDLPADFDGVEVCDYAGNRMSSQIIEETSTEGVKCRKVVFLAEKVPAKGYKAFLLKKASPDAETEIHSLKADKSGFCNRFFDIKLDENGNISSLFDRVNGREVLKAGKKANVLQAFEDKPHNFDAWDINVYYQEKMWEITGIESIEAVESGPVRASLRIRRKFLDSTINQDIHIYNDIPRIDFVNRIDWKEKQILLKAAFPVDIHTDKATYEIQYGNVERPTHWNTSWDFARFEVCAHKWADLSEDGYGVSLMNDCKYGHDIKDGTMRLTLLKSAVEPNVDADRETHEFTYSLFPHAGSWKTAGTVSMAYALNCPMYTKIEDAHAGHLPVEFSLLKLDRENVVVEVVKKAEDSESFVVRLYECCNRRSTVRLTFFKELAEVKECDLMENDLNGVQISRDSFSFEIMPYEIKTFKLKG